MSYCSNQAHIFTKFRNLQFKADIAEFGCQNPFFLSLNYCVKVLLQCACASAQWHTYGHAQKNYVCFYSLVLFPCVMFDLDFRCVYLPQDTIHSLTALCEVCNIIEWFVSAPSSTASTDSWIVYYLKGFTYMYYCMITEDLSNAAILLRPHL